MTPDGSRLYVGIQSTFFNTGYGMGFLPGGHAYVIDTITNRIAATIDLGALNTPAGIGVTADRGAVYIAVPTLNEVAVVDVNTNVVTAHIPLTAGPSDLAVVPVSTVTRVPYAIDAVDDSGTVLAHASLTVVQTVRHALGGGRDFTVLFVALGAVAAAAEFRHGTAIPTFLATPRRPRALRCRARARNEKAEGIGASNPAASSRPAIRR